PRQEPNEQPRSSVDLYCPTDRTLTGEMTMATGTSDSFDTLDRNWAMSSLLAQNWWAIALRGVFAIIFALIAFFWPGATLLSFVLIFSAYMLVDGIFAIVAAVRAASANQRWGLLALGGVADILDRKSVAQ